MNEITYQNKVALNENSEIADINKVKASDMNEIKSVVNTNSQTSSNNFGLGTDTWTSSETYAIGDIVVYNSNTYKNLTGTNTTTTPDQDSTNWEVMPLIIDEYNTSTKNAYSCDYVNNAIKDVYSTNEVKTNKVWIDGKPIYRKCYVIPKSATSGEIIIYNTGITDIDMITKLEGIIKRTDNQFDMIPSNLTNNDYLSYFEDATRQSIRIRIGSSLYINVFDTLYMTLEYTKTTD